MAHIHHRRPHAPPPSAVFQGKPQPADQCLERCRVVSELLRPRPQFPGLLEEDGPEKILSGGIAITGAASGMGEADALLLAGRGAKVVLGDVRSDRLQDLVDRIAKEGGQAVQLRTDVTQKTDLASLVALACDSFGRLDVLVNNAGIMPVSALDELRVDDWEAMVDVNIKGVLFGIAAALPVFVSKGTGILSTWHRQPHIWFFRPWPYIPVQR